MCLPHHIGCRSDAVRSVYGGAAYRCPYYCVGFMRFCCSLGCCSVVTGRFDLGWIVPRAWRCCWRSARRCTRFLRAASCGWRNRAYLRTHVVYPRHCGLLWVWRHTFQRHRCVRIRPFLDMSRSMFISAICCDTPDGSSLPVDAICSRFVVHISRWLLPSFCYVPCDLD